MTWFKHKQADSPEQPHDFATMVRQAREQDPKHFDRIQTVFSPFKHLPTQNGAKNNRHGK